MVNKSSSLSSTERLPSERSSDLKFKGVRKRKWGKYVSEIRLPNSRERIWLGSHDTAEKAARAFDAALYCLRGAAAKFNFPDNPPEIPGGRSLTPAEIQAAASNFANSGRSESSHSDSRSSSSSSSSSSEEPRAESPFSDGAPEMESETMYPAVDLSFLDQFATIGSYSGGDILNSVPDYGIFPGFDDFSYLPQPLPNNEYLEYNCDAVFAQETSFLWNF